MTFSPRERQVAALLVEGREYTEIAAALTISLSTVKSHVHKLYKKTGARGRSTLIFALIREGAAAQPNVDMSQEGIKRRFTETADVTDPYYPDMGKLSPGERVYIDAFMRFMRTPADSEVEIEAAREREACLAALFVEKRIPWWHRLPGGRIPHEVRLQLAGTITGYTGMSRAVGERFVDAYLAA